MKRFLVERVDQGIVIELDRFGLLGAAIDDSRRATGAAQPAARASSFGAAGKGGKFELHDVAPVVCGLPCAYALRSSAMATMPPAGGDGESLEL
jgi:hypothetical protein